jgi:hypothetical protein
MSANSAKPSNYVPELLAGKGYEIYPINPTAEEIGGKKCFKNILDVEGEIDILNVFRPSDQTIPVVQEAIERKKLRGDIKVIWLQEGIYNDEAKQLALENGFVFVQDRCMKVEYYNSIID